MCVANLVGEGKSGGCTGGVLTDAGPRVTRMLVCAYWAIKGKDIMHLT